MTAHYPEAIDYRTDQEIAQEIQSSPSLRRYQAFQSRPTAEIIIIEPTSFDDMPNAIQALKQNQMIVLNLIHMEHEEAQRSVDFMAGGTLMFNGAIEKIDQKIFIFAPNNTEILFGNN
jgi:FtsZ-interacting cell division protein YlmF